MPQRIFRGSVPLDGDVDGTASDIAGESIDPSANATDADDMNGLVVVACVKLGLVVATLAIFAVVIYLQGFRIEIPIKSNKFRGQRGSYPVKLFYTSNMPIMLESALTSNIFILSQMLASRFPDNLLVRLLGVWEPIEGSPQLQAVSGIAYYMSPPHTIKAVLLDPIHAFIYIAFITTACAIFSKTWIEVSGSGPRDIAKQLKEQQMVRADLILD